MFSYLRLRTTTLYLGIAVLLAACLSGSSPVYQTGVADPDYALAIERGRNIVAPLVRRGSAVSVAVGVDGELVWSEAWGRTARETGSPVQADDPMRLYSLMKQFTAVLALQSVMRGEIGFDTSAQSLLPELPDEYREVTLQQLLAHRGGIRHYIHPSEALFFNHCDNAGEALHRFTNDALVSTPGSQENYSTYGFVLASAMLERATGHTFPQLVQQRLAVPLGLTSLTVDSRSDDRLLNFYDVDSDGEVSIAPPVDNSCKMGGGGFMAAAADVVRIHNAVMTGELAPEPAIRSLLAGRSELSAAGSGAGGEAMSVADLDRRLSVVVLSNTSGLEQRLALTRVRELLAAVFSGNPSTAAATQASNSLTSALGAR